MKGLIIKSTGLWYVVLLDGKNYKARLRGKFKLDSIKLTNPIAVGDWVEIEPNKQIKNEWIIVRIYPRDNYVIRQSPRNKGLDHLIASNIDQGVLIATLKTPRTSIGFIDRFLISLEAYRISGIIIFNKSDLYTQKDHLMVEEFSRMYQKIGYKVLKMSFLKDQLPVELVSVLEGKTSLICGHSGAGKSTMINKLIPEANLEVKEVSDFSNKGVHTTTFSELFQVNEKTKIIDTPGIKELGLAEIHEDELSHYFPEMREYLGECKFHNCLHDKEPDCAIKEQIGKSVSEIRYKSYLSILKNEDNRV